jgi:hypothetical protein
MQFMRRDFLKSALAASSAATAMVAGSHIVAKVQAQADWQRNARFLADRLVKWQSPYGGPDPKSPYRSDITATVIQGIAPQVRALYRMYELTGDKRYKHAADRHVLFYFSTLRDTPKPFSNMVTIDSKPLFSTSAAWIYGKALSPCYEWFVKFNPDDPSLKLKAYAIYDWLQVHRRNDSYFGVGYPIGKFEDAQFSCDLGEVGSGLVGFYKATKHERALTDAKGLAQYFLTEHKAGSAKGVWSSKLGTWLVGPWPGGGAEHFTTQQYDQVGWGWSCLVDAEFLLELRPFVEDEKTRKSIDDKCVSAMRWCVDQCQFEDGAHGMFGRDDKWVGQTAAAILLYKKLSDAGLLSSEVKQKYSSKVRKSWNWLLSRTSAETYPKNGYIKVSGSTTTKPPENLLWMMSWSIEALIDGGRYFGM